MPKLNVRKLLDSLSAGQLDAQIAAMKAELTLLEEVRGLRARLAKALGSAAEPADKPARQGGSIFARAIAWLKENGPADAKQVAEALGEQRAVVYQALKKKEVKRTRDGQWTA